MIVQQYIMPHSKNQHYKTLLKALLKQACVPVALLEVKDLETCVAGIKSDKIKEDKAAKEAKKGTEMLHKTHDPMNASVLRMLVWRHVMRDSTQQSSCFTQCLPQTKSADLVNRSQCILQNVAAVAGKKKNVNVGSKGGSAGLDDYKYDEPLDDAEDFM